MNAKMCRKLKFSLFLAVLLSCLVTIISCSNLFDDIETPSANTITLNGTIRSLFSDNSAVPSEYAALFAQSDETDFRAAIPTLPTSNLTTIVTATANGEDPITKEIEDSSFTIPLKSGKKWTVTVTMKNNDTEMLSDSKEFDLTSVGAVSHEFVLKPVTGGTGNVSLTLDIEATCIKTLLIEIPGRNPINWKKNTSTNKWSIPGNQSQVDKTNPNITLNGINSGVYTATLRFFDNHNDEANPDAQIFSMQQEINVLKTLSTTKWVLDGTVCDTLSITQGMVDTNVRTDFFVGDYGTVAPSDTNGTGSPYKPVATITKAVSLISTLPAKNASNEPIEYTIHVKHGTTEEISSTISIQKNITIECWKNTVGDNLGTATIKWNGDSSGTMISIYSGGVLTIAGEKTGNESWSGLVLDGNKSEGKSAGGINCVSGGTLYLNGGAIKNCSGVVNYASAIYIAGTVEMNGGIISRNELTSAIAMGTVYIGPANSSTPGSFTMKGGIICDNEYYNGTSDNSPSVYLATGSFNMSDGEITRNSTDKNCAGVFMNSNVNSVFTMTGGKIYGNTNNGQAIGVKVSNNTKFNMSGSAYIASDNIVTLPGTNSQITITGAVTPPAGSNGISATITPRTYSSGTQVLNYADGVSSDVFAAACSKFAITKQSGSDSIWHINNEGLIQKFESITDGAGLSAAITSGKSNISVEEDITIENGFSGNESNKITITGGGEHRISTENTNDTIVFEYVNFVNGKITTSGEPGGMLMLMGDGTNTLIIRNCSFTNCATPDRHGEGQNGGSVYINGFKNITIENTTFYANDGEGYREEYAATSGGFIYIDGLDVEDAIINIKGCSFTGGCSSHGGALAIQLENTASMTIDNCTFTNNYADWNGGVIDFSKGCYITIKNSVFNGNSSYLGNNVFINSEAGFKYVVVTNCTIDGTLVDSTQQQDF